MNLRKDKIAIVIPVYNKEKFISNTLDSINNLSVKPDEVIIIDDGSTDNSLELITNMTLTKTYRIISQKNQGVSSARNNGLKFCTSDYVLFLDADDILREDALVWFKRYINEGYKIIAGNRINKQGQIYIDTNNDIEFNQQKYLDLLYNNINLCWTSAVLLKKELLLTNKFNEKFSHGEDRDLFYRVLAGQKAIFTKSILAEYINDESGLSNKIISPSQDLFFELVKSLSEMGPFDIKNLVFLIKYRLKRFHVSLRNSQLKIAFRWLVE